MKPIEAGGAPSFASCLLYADFFVGSFYDPEDGSCMFLRLVG
jgi:hypothetical protein